MTLPSENDEPLGPSTEDEAESTAIVDERRFAALETQLAQAPEVAGRIARKHWPLAEREQYPFWIGILVLALLGVAGMYSTRRYSYEVQLIPALIAGIMVVGLAVILGYYLHTLQYRFGRLWTAMTADGELFRYLRDSGVVLGYPIEMGEPDERFTSHVELAFQEAVGATESCLRASALPEPVPPDAPPGLRFQPYVLEEAPGSEIHKVYEAEYHGSVIRALTVRVAESNGGSDLTVGFPVRPTRAETRDRVVAGLLGRLEDRLLAGKILADIRDAAGMPALPVPLAEAQPLASGVQPLEAI